MLYRLYIGANNKTKQVEVNRIKKISNSYFKGFSILSLKGYWENVEEDSIILEIETDDKDKVLRLANILKIKLQQEAIGFQELPSLSFI